ncbi:hypothetical protein B0H13DRAFT_2446250 [Mycena leptocephala]|nr:hypothetical protein B0H13DRAFT_2446250 [Mycena leptocephala]
MSPTLSSGSHDLVITQTAAQAEGVIFLDYIMYNTTSTSMPYFIDDRDPRITYTPPWTQEGSDQDFQHTVQRTSTTGDSFSLEFEGSSISFYGGITSQTINASAVIDGGPPTFSGRLRQQRQPTTCYSVQAHFLRRDVVRLHPIQRIPFHTFQFGRHVVRHRAFRNSFSILQVDTIGAIVGPIVGALVLIVSVAVFFIYRRRRDRRRRSPTLPMSNVFEPTPFSGFVASWCSSSRVAAWIHLCHHLQRFPGRAPELRHSAHLDFDFDVKFKSVLGHDGAPAPAQTGAGVLPSNKLLREAERMRHDPPPALGTHSGSGPSSVAGSASARESQPPQYFE